MREYTIELGGYGQLVVIEDLELTAELTELGLDLTDAYFVRDLAVKFNVIGLATSSNQILLDYGVFMRNEMFRLKQDILLHERVHLKQLAEGRLVFNSDGSHMFEGVRYEGRAEYGATPAEVLAQPWEREAYAVTPKVLFLTLPDLENPKISDMEAVAQALWDAGIDW